MPQYLNFYSSYPNLDIETPLSDSDIETPINPVRIPRPCNVIEKLQVCFIEFFNSTELALSSQLDFRWIEKKGGPTGSVRYDEL